MYICKKYKIKSKLIFTNWDNATTKPYAYKPDQVYCWGYETAKLSKKIHSIKSTLLEVLGLRSIKNSKLN